MSCRKSAVAMAVMAAFLGSSALAQQTGGDQHHPAGGSAAQTAPSMPMSGMAQGMPADTKPGSGGMPMMGMMQMMMGPSGMGQMGGMMSGHVEGRIAFLKTELKITDSQQKLWDAVANAIRANAIRANATSIGDTPNGMAMMGSAATLPDKLAAREKMMSTHLDQLRKLKAAIEPLYASFDGDQKKTADELMSGPMGMGMM